MSLTACQSTPAIYAAIYRPNGTLHQLQPSFHTSSTEPEPTARARRAGEEFYWTTPEFMFVSFRLLVVDPIQSASTFTEPSLLIRTSAPPQTPSNSYYYFVRSVDGCLLAREPPRRGSSSRAAPDSSAAASGQFHADNHHSITIPCLTSPRRRQSVGEGGRGCGGAAAEGLYLRLQ